MTHNMFHTVIIGGGPTGLVLANLLGTSGLRVAIVESDIDVYPVPRATHLDEETLRNFQLTGLMPELEQYTSPFGKMEIVNKKGATLFQQYIQQTSVQHGYEGSRFFYQPAFERILRKGLQRYPNITFLAGYRALDITEQAETVTATIQSITTSETIEINSNWAIGCDGGKSLVRTKLGIQMEMLAPSHDWMIVDTVLKNPADAVLLPDKFRYILGQERISLFAYGFGNNNRWEFQLNTGEATPSDSTVLSWVAKDIALEKIDVTRIARYAHQSLVAKKWKSGRILLAGDAAHMMPPTAGQGLCSGVRDAVNLAWKLEAVIKANAPIKLLDTYEQERKQNLMEICQRAIFFSNRIQAGSKSARLLRTIELRLIENIAPLKKFLNYRYNSPPVLKQGWFVASSNLAGTHLPQIATAGDATTYQWQLVYNAQLLNNYQLSKLKNKALHLVCNSEVSKWLHKNKSSFALVRPDKIVFATGNSDAYESALLKASNLAL